MTRVRAVLGDSPIPEESPATLLQHHHDLGGAPAARPGQCPASAREDEPVVTNGEAVMSAPAVSASVTQTLRIGHGAVLRAIQGNSVDVAVPVLGTVRLPPLDSLALYGGLAALAAIGLMEWPVAAAIGAGHLLVQQQHFRLLHDFGEALEKA
jgi:hypothetical protein